MAVFNSEIEYLSAISPAKLFKAFILDADNLHPKVIPHAVQSIELIEGNGGPGSVKKINFPQGGQYNYVKHKVDALDTENLIYRYSITEGKISETIDLIENEVKIVDSPDGGSILKINSKFHTKVGADLKEDDIKAGKEKVLVLLKAVEAHLIANPNAYN